MPVARIHAKEILAVHLSAWKAITLSSLVWSALVLDVLLLVSLESMLEYLNILTGSRLIWKMAVEAHLHPQPLDPQPLDHPQPLLLPQALDAEAQIGLVIISAMTKTTMLTATLMVVTAVEMMSTHNIAVLVNVLKVPLLPLPLLLQQPLRLLPPEVANSKIGLVTISVMMETTMPNATLMVVTVVVLMSTQLSAAFANAMKYVETHNGKVTTSVMMKTTMLDATLMGVTVVVKMSILPIAPTVLA